MSKKRIFNFYLPDVTREKLEKLANRFGITLAEVIRRALDDYIQRHRE